MHYLEQYLMYTIRDEDLTGVVGEPFKVRLNHVNAYDFASVNSVWWSSYAPKLNIHYNQNMKINVPKINDDYIY